MTAPPVFIVGSPRSGTSLMRRLLDRHPAVAICGETHFYRLVYLRRKAFGDLNDPANRRRLIAEYFSSHHIRRAKLDSAEFVDRLSREATSYRAMFTAMLSYYAEMHGKRRYGEKTPQHAFFLETLCEWFPNAVILHMIRDPRASVASLQRAEWTPGSVVTNARTWLEHNRAARLFRDRPGYLEVRYEALVTDPVTELRRICAVIGEEYSPLMQQPEVVLSAESKPSMRSRAAVTSERLDVWRSELTAAQVAQIEWVLGSELENFGYTRSAAPASAFTVLRGVSYAAFDYGRFVTARLPAVWYRFGAQTKIAKFERWSDPESFRKDPKGP
jgi:Sulfotransferase family